LCPECGDNLFPLSDIYSLLNIDESPLPLFTIGGVDFFLFAPLGVPSWAILSLLLTVAGVILSLNIIVRAVRQKQNENMEFDEHSAKLFGINSLENIQLLCALENEHLYNQRRRLGAMTMMYILSIGAVLLLILVQDFMGIIALFDFWVIVHSLLFVGILLCGKLVFKRYKVADSPLYAPTSASVSS